MAKENGTGTQTQFKASNVSFGDTRKMARLQAKIKRLDAQIEASATDMDVDIDVLFDRQDELVEEFMQVLARGVDAIGRDMLVADAPEGIEDTDDWMQYVRMDKLFGGDEGTEGN